MRRWLPPWLYRQGVEHTARLAPEALAEIAPQPTELGDMLTALAATLLAFRRRFTRCVPNWTLVGILTRGRLLTPAPSD